MIYEDLLKDIELVTESRWNAFKRIVGEHFGVDYESHRLVLSEAFVSEFDLNDPGDDDVWLTPFLERGEALVMDRINPPFTIPPHTTDGEKHGEMPFLGEVLERQLSEAREALDP